MTIDDKPFITFGEFHIPLSEWDIFNIHARRGKYPQFGFITPHGESYGDMVNFLSEEQIMANMKRANNEKQAQFHLQTMVEANTGETLKGEDLMALAKESKETGVPLAVLAKRLNGKVKTIVSPAHLVKPVLRTKTKSGR